MMNINSQPVMVEANGKQLSKLQCKIGDSPFGVIKQTN